MLKTRKSRRRRAARAGIRRPIGMTLGFLLQGLALLWAAAVTWEGGIIRETRPITSSEVSRGVASALAGRQDVESLFAEAVERGGGQGARDGQAVQAFRQSLDALLDELVTRHHLTMSNPDSPPRGYRTSLREFFDEDFPDFPRKCQISVDDVTPIGIHYRPGEMYSLLCATDLSPQVVFKAYLTEFNERGWVVDAPVYDTARHMGKLVSSDGEWALAIIVAPIRPEWQIRLILPPGLNPPAPLRVLVYWELIRL